MKHKSGLIGFSYLAGLVCAAFFNQTAAAVLGAVAAAAAVTLLLLGKRTYSAVFFTLSLAFLAYRIYTVNVYLPAASLDGKISDISGRITEINRFSGDAASYVIKADIDGISTYVTLFSADSGGAVGDNVSFTGKLSLMTDSTVFSAKSFYGSKGIFLAAAPKSDIVISKGSIDVKGLIVSYSEYIGAKISNMLNCEEGGLIKAMFLGDKSDLSDELAYNIKRAGVSHFTAVSGMHMTVISHLIMLIISLTPLKRRRYLKFTVLMALILMFTVFFRLSASVIRSGIMLTLYYGSEPLMRKSDPINSMGAAVLIITLLNPYACTDAGLLLSLAGTFGVGVVSPMICGHYFKKRGRYYPLKCGIAASMCALMCTLPLSFIFFGGVSLTGVLTNLLIFPLAVPTVFCTALFAATGGISHGLMLAAGLFAKLMRVIISFFGELKYSYFGISFDFILPITLLSVIFAVTVYKRFDSVKRTAEAIVLSIGILIAFSTVCTVFQKDYAFISMYSDGNDACVIVEQGGNMLAVLTDDSPKLSERLRQYAKESFTEELSAICLLNNGNNNADALEAIPCALFLPPDTISEIRLDNISIAVSERSCTIDINGISVTVSPASAPIDDEIAILYGYKQNIPQLSGLTFCSCKRNIPDNTEFYNLYYSNAEYIITDSGCLQQR